MRMTSAHAASPASGTPLTYSKPALAVADDVRLSATHWLWLAPAATDCWAEAEPLQQTLGELSPQLDDAFTQGQWGGGAHFPRLQSPRTDGDECRRTPSRRKRCRVAPHPHRDTAPTVGDGTSSTPDNPVGHALLQCCAKPGLIAGSEQGSPASRIP